MSMQPWFEQAKLGIFIHWGIYAVKGIAESWSFFNGQISHEDYMKQLDGFTAAKYDPDAWADLFAEARAQYAVLTTRHHDGVALWDTQAPKSINVVRDTPAGRDLIGPYCEALRKRGLRVGLYYSHSDWSHPDYPTIFRADMHREGNYEGHSRFTTPQRRGDEDPKAWQRFLRYHRKQLGELCTQFKPDLLWFDGDWERDAVQWDMAGLRRFLHRKLPRVVLNSRMNGHGDYATPEQGIPVRPPEGVWEFCVTVNDSWGWQRGDNNWTSPRQLVRMFAETIGMGGRMLLDIGPRADGSIPREAASRLRRLGRWIGKHEAATLGSVAGLPHGHFYGPSTLSADRRKLYLFYFDAPRGELSVKGVRNKVLGARVLGRGAECGHRKIGGAPWMNIPGMLWIDVPERALDELCTVIEVELDGPLDLYTGRGGAVEAN